jgi:hypothetical protein
MSGSNGSGPELEDQAAELDGLAELAPVVEFGRYRLFVTEEGLVLARAVDTCERCQSCGCGTQADPLPLPDPRRGRMHLMGWLASNANQGIMGALSKVMSSGD